MKVNIASSGARVFEIKNTAQKNKRKAIFLDRDGVLNKYKDYIVHPGQVELYEDTVQAVKKINDSDYYAIVVSNQAAIAKGKSSEENIQQVFIRLNDLLKNEGAILDGIYYCPHHPQGEVAELKIDCDCRKPKTGMFEEAAKDFNLSLKACYMIGDDICDIELARNAEIGAIFKKSEKGVTPPAPDYVADTLMQAVEFILNKN